MFFSVTSLVNALFKRKKRVISLVFVVIRVAYHGINNLLTDSEELTVYLTENMPGDRDFHHRDESSIIMVFQMRAIDTARFVRRLSSLSATDLDMVDAAI